LTFCSPTTTPAWQLVKTWKENKLEPAWEGLLLVLLTMETAIWTTEHGKEGAPPDQKEQWAALSHSGNTKVTLKRL
jgi:hypothetical protein